MPDQNNPTDTTATPSQVNPPSEPSQMPTTPPAPMDIPAGDASIPPPFPPPDSGSAAPSFDIPPVIMPSQPKKKFGGKRVIATILGILLLIGGVGVGVALVKQQQDIREKAAYPTPTPTPTGGGNWNQCTSSSGPIPCGSCSIKSVGAGTMTFGCELNCGGSASNCPGGSAGSYSIAHRWEKCKNKGTAPCTGSSSDYIESGDLGGPGPWDISGQSLIDDGSGTFPNPGCGRVQVDVQMSAQGTNVAGKTWDSGTDCAGATVPPPPPPTGPPTAQCLKIQAFDTSWNKLSLTDLSSLRPGDSVRFTVAGQASSGVFDKARFKINGVQRPEVTGKRPGTEEFFDEYTIPEGITTFSINAQIHHETLGWSN